MAQQSKTLTKTVSVELGKILSKVCYLQYAIAEKGFKSVWSVA